MGESPDRSIRTAGAEEQEAERSTAEAEKAAEKTEQAEATEPAAPTPTDSPTRTLRPREARDDERDEERDEPEADEAEEPEAEAEAGEPAVDSETRVLRAPVIEKAPGADEADAEAEEPEAEVAEPEADSETRVLRAPVIEKTPEAEPERPEAEEAEAAEEPAESEDVAEDEPEAETESEAEVADDADPEEDPEPEAAEPPAGGAQRPSVADEETRPMSALPPIPPPPGSSGSSRSSAPSSPSTPSSPSGPSAPPARPAPAAAPARGVPVGATAVADTPETTVEAMEVLAKLSARPMTPARIALRRVRLYGTLLVLLVLVLGTVQALRPLPSPRLQQSAVGSYTFDGGSLALDWPVSGQAAVSVPGLGMMGKSGSGNPVPLASVTKMMTAYIVLHDHPLKKGEPGPTITVDQGAVNDYNTGGKSGESVQRVTAGERLSEYQALQMLMIPSANNIARLLGRWDAGTDAAFVQKMQATAAQLGMTQSTYTDPSGLVATTRSTAEDQLKLATAAMAVPVFREVVGTQSFNSPLNGPTPNTNTLVGKNGVIGIKTGTSTAALGNLVWAAEQPVGGVDQMIVGVTLSQPAVGGGPGQGILDQVLANSKKLVISAEQTLQGHTIAHKGDVVGYVDDGLGGRTPVVVTQDVQVAGWSGLSVGVSLRPVDGKAVPHSAAAGTVVGELVVGSGPTAQTVPVALGSDLAAPGFGAKLTRLS